MLRKRSRSRGQVFRITGARQGLDEDVRGRQRRYVISMGVRTVSVILAITLWNVTRPVAAVALVLGFILPYIAVVIANAGRENAPMQPSSFVPTVTRMMLPARSKPTDRERAHPRPPASDTGPRPGSWPPEAPESPAADSGASGGPTTATADPPEPPRHDGDGTP